MLLVHVFVNNDFITILRLVTSEIISNKRYLCDQQKQIMYNTSVIAGYICRKCIVEGNKNSTLF